MRSDKQDVVCRPGGRGKRGASRKRVDAMKSASGIMSRGDCEEVEDRGGRLAPSMRRRRAEGASCSMHFIVEGKLYENSIS